VSPVPLRISVAMCTWRGERFLGQQLASLAAQTRLPDELVVRDDGSDDGTIDLLESFAARAPFAVRITRNPTRLGASHNFGAAIADCRGDVIVLCDQDDVWRPDKLERHEEAFAGPRHPGLVFSDGILVDEASQPTGRTCWQAVGMLPAHLEGLAADDALPTIVDRQRHYGGTVTGATMSFRAEWRELVLPIPEWMAEPRPVLIHDAWITLVVAAVAPLTALPEPLISYRTHPSQAAGLPVLDKTAPAVGLAGLRGASQLSGPQVGKVAELQWTSSLLDRLRQRRPEGADRAVADLSGRVAHLRARVELPEARLRRVVPVLRELGRGRYRAYSSGLRSAARDLSGGTVGVPGGDGARAH